MVHFPRLSYLILSVVTCRGSFSWLELISARSWSDMVVNVSRPEESVMVGAGAGLTAS